MAFLTGHELGVGYCSLKSLKVWIVITQHGDEDYGTKTKKDVRKHSDFSSQLTDGYKVEKIVKTISVLIAAPPT